MERKKDSFGSSHNCLFWQRTIYVHVVLKRNRYGVTLEYNHGEKKCKKKKKIPKEKRNYPRTDARLDSEREKNERTVGGKYIIMCTYYFVRFACVVYVLYIRLRGYRYIVIIILHYWQQTTASSGYGAFLFLSRTDNYYVIDNRQQTIHAHTDLDAITRWSFRRKHN